MRDRVMAGRLATTKSNVLLLGPRQVGKSTICRHLRAQVYVDLADEAESLGYAKDPARLRREVDALPPGSLVVVDEVQRVPALLNTVQSLADRRGRRGPRDLWRGLPSRRDPGRGRDAKSRRLWSLPRCDRARERAVDQLLEAQLGRRSAQGDGAPLRPAARRHAPGPPPAALPPEPVHLTPARPARAGAALRRGRPQRAPRPAPPPARSRSARRPLRAMGDASGDLSEPCPAPRMEAVDLSDRGGSRGGSGRRASPRCRGDRDQGGTAGDPGRHQGAPFAGRSRRATTAARTLARIPRRARAAVRLGRRGAPGAGGTPEARGRVTKTLVSTRRGAPSRSP